MSSVPGWGRRYKHPRKGDTCNYRGFTPVSFGLGGRSFVTLFTKRTPGPSWNSGAFAGPSALAVTPRWTGVRVSLALLSCPRQPCFNWPLRPALSRLTGKSLESVPVFRGQKETRSVRKTTRKQGLAVKPLSELKNLLRWASLSNWQLIVVINFHAIILSIP